MRLKTKDLPIIIGMICIILMFLTRNNFWLSVIFFVIAEIVFFVDTYLEHKKSKGEKRS